MKNIIALFVVLIQALVLVGIVLVIFAFFMLPPVLGIEGFGPKREVTAKVERLYVDSGNKKSHYMVGTDQGVFEVSNGVILWLWNADEIYSRLKEGKTYRLTIKGNQVVNFFFQEYRYIISTEEVKQ